MKTTNICPGTLATGFNTYSPSCLRKVFYGKKVSHVIDFSLDNGDENIIASVNRISISGVQEKLLSAGDHQWRLHTYASIRPHEHLHTYR